MVHQAAAICLVTHPTNSPRVILVRSKRTGDWGIPKGTIEEGEASGEAAAREARGGGCSELGECGTCWSFFVQEGRKRRSIRRSCPYDLEK
ncbi:NUDIX domain-containing protein [Rhizobium grahamii]|uniref:NUDIX domain-containing protein n=1 Tax=Rhizobium grahamii TaxID=1120045 RepID=UPI003CC82E77